MFYICKNFVEWQNKEALQTMRAKTFCIVLPLLFSICVFAQKHELGIELGASNLVGDVGRTNFILQKPIHLFDKQMTYYGIPFYGGIVYRLNLNPYQTLRFNAGYEHVQFDDSYATELYRRNRKLWGTNSIFEFDALFEYNFLPVNEEQKSMLSPYIFGGVGLMYVTGGKKKSTQAIPFGAGLKYKFNYNWALSGNFTFRPTFSDNIDYSATNNIGNLNSKDWVNSATLMLTYAFGRPPCYCR